MFITIKPKYMLAVLALIVTVAAALCGINYAIYQANAVPYNGNVVVIDAGHGGRDGGVVGVKTGVTEAEINLLIARSLEAILRQRGYKVVMTRTNSNGLYQNNASNFKMSDMNARKKIIQNAKPNLMVSIHQNSFPRSYQTGAQVFYAQSLKSSENADKMQKALNEQLPNSSRQARAGDYYVLNCTEYPSLLVECGFLTTPAEEALLVTAAYQERVAYAIFSGINAILVEGQGQTAA